MSAIAREFDCTPSAISYIVRKAEAGAPPSEEAEPGEKPVAAPIAAPPIAAPPAAAPSVVTPKAATSITTLSLPDRGSSQPRQSTLVLTPPAPPPAPAAPPAPPPVAAAPAPVAAPAPAPEAPRPAAETGAATAKPAQPPPVDATEARLRETARGCLVAYRSWRQATGETSTQTLNDAVHELRKVLARIEIDMSASRREEQVLRPMPIPAHRAARQQQRS